MPAVCFYHNFPRRRSPGPVATSGNRQGSIGYPLLHKVGGWNRVRRVFPSIFVPPDLLRIRHWGISCVFDQSISDFVHVPLCVLEVSICCKLRQAFNWRDLLWSDVVVMLPRFAELSQILGGTQQGWMIWLMTPESCTKSIILLQRMHRSLDI